MSLNQTGSDSRKTRMTDISIISSKIRMESTTARLICQVRVKTRMTLVTRVTQVTLVTLEVLVTQVMLETFMMLVTQ